MCLGTHFLNDFFQLLHIPSTYGQVIRWKQNIFRPFTGFSPTKTDFGAPKGSFLFPNCLLEDKKMKKMYKNV